MTAGVDIVMKARGLTKSYRRRAGVKDVSVHVRQGEIVGLLGPNGAGKTTTFYMLVGLIRPDSGRIQYRDVDVTSRPMHKRARLGMGYLSQEPSVFRKLSVEDNLMAVLETLDLSGKERRIRQRTLLKELGLEKVARQKAYTLSGGERRKLEISRALVSEPAMLMLDGRLAAPSGSHEEAALVERVLRLHGRGFRAPTPPPRK